MTAMTRRRRVEGRTPVSSWSRSPRPWSGSKEVRSRSSKLRGIASLREGGGILEAFEVRADGGGDLAEMLVERAGEGVGLPARAARVGGVALGVGGIAEHGVAGDGVEAVVAEGGGDGGDAANGRDELVERGDVDAVDVIGGLGALPVAPRRRVASLCRAGTLATVFTAMSTTTSHSSFVKVAPRPMTTEERRWIHDIVSANPAWADA